MTVEFFRLVAAEPSVPCRCSDRKKERRRRDTAMHRTAETAGRQQGFLHTSLSQLSSSAASRPVAT